MTGRWRPDRLFADDTGLLPPEPQVGYTGVLRSPQARTTALQAVGGVLAALVGYSLLLPLIAAGLLGITWRLLDRPGPLAEYRTAALSYQYVEGMLVAHVAIGSVILVVMAVVRLVHQRHPRWLSSVQPGFRWRYGFVCALVALAGLNGIYWISQLGAEQTWQPGPGAWQWLMAIVLTSPIQAAAEEYLFRGYLMQAIGSVLRPWLAVLLSAVVFTAMHGTQNPALLADRLGFGLLAGCLVLFTGGLEAAIAAHAVNNVFAFGYAVLRGGLVETRAIQASDWATTGWNLLAYGLVGLACWSIGRRMRVASRTPGLAS